MHDLVMVIYFAAPLVIIGLAYVGYRLAVVGGQLFELTEATRELTRATQHAADALDTTAENIFWARTYRALAEDDEDVVEE